MLALLHFNENCGRPAVYDEDGNVKIRVKHTKGLHEQHGLSVVKEESTRGKFTPLHTIIEKKNL